MGCKYCNGITPLAQKGDMRLHLTQDKYGVGKLVVDHLGGKVEIIKEIDFCPICGEEIKPFGPSWAHHHV